VNLARVTDETPVNIEDFDVHMESWSHYGYAYAVESAREWTTWGARDLPQLVW
jgi:hypothetical protein